MEITIDRKLAREITDDEAMKLYHRRLGKLSLAPRWEVQQAILAAGSSGLDILRCVIYSISMVPISFIKKVVFRPSKAGLGKMLGSVEQPVLEALWEKGSLTGRELYEEVRRSKALAYTTVLTTVGRMVKKGILKRKKVDGLYYYEPAMIKSEFERQSASAVIKGIFEISTGYAVSAFVDTLSQWDESKLDEIMGIIEKRRKAEGR